MKRSSGILMPIFSLPSPYGIGTLGKEAFNFIDFLAKAKQSYWQILPVGPTSYGDSPYQSPSTFAGNPYFIDLDLLEKDGLLTRGEIDSVDWGTRNDFVDYGILYNNRFPLLEKASDRCWEREPDKIRAFADSTPWLGDYALYMAVKRHFKMAAWLDWPDEDIRLRKHGALEKYRQMLEKDVRFYTFLQYVFYSQWEALKEYAHKNKIEIIGDIPIYVALDSADVWAEPQFFQLDEDNVPKEVSGVPPDYFSEEGQLWGNPLYDYKRMADDGFGWWIRRISGAAKLYDVLRIDHFRGLESYWSVPYGETTAKNGHWVKGPGMALISVLKGWFGNLKFIAEDLGYPTPEVAQLLADSGFPGMKVLEFAFDHREVSSHLPHTYSFNCICYTGTHDNTTLVGWKKEADPKDLVKAQKYLGLNKEEGFVRGMIRGGMASTANVFIAQIQDWLELDESARVNTPGKLGGNWTWRMQPGLLTEKLAKEISELTVLYGR
ncbi:MAG: 4-alpha-glucanotransferase [Lachnospiraceae bacterium]|nr:4-alpha-glucanotransferase [Lachnospiraceae bacterium]